MKKLEAPAIAVLNKVDKLQDKSKLLALIEQVRRTCTVRRVYPDFGDERHGRRFAAKGDRQALPKGEAMYPKDHLTDQPSRFLAAEILREKILHHTQKEVPHAVAVMVETWVETPKLLKIAATIYVEKAGQKAILIGAGGAGLKKIGTIARYEMEKTFEKKVFLQTFVKVKPNWRQDPEFLASIDWRGMMGQ